MASYPCRAVDASFFASAPERHVLEVEVACSPARLFEILDDADSWPRWVPGIKKVTWHTPAPRGAGAERTVTLLGGAEILEHFNVWKPGAALAFYLREANQPIWHSFAENYEIVDLGGKTKLTWTVAYEPRDGFAKVHPWIRPVMRLALKSFMWNLKRYVARQAQQPVTATA